MIVLPTAKVLLFIALNLGPQNPSMIYATSNSESYVWTPTKTGWDVVALGFPASDSPRNDSIEIPFTGDPSTEGIPSYIRSISKDDWSHDNAAVFDNGDRIEKHGDHAFYIVNAGGPNEKDFTILFPTASESKDYVKRSPGLVRVNPHP
jgi:hypothetical protein